MKQLEVVLFAEPAIRVPADTLVIPVPRDERPLRGEAGWVDWRVCGALSAQLTSGFVSGVRGESVLLPAPRPLAAARILLIGIGNTGRLDGRVLQRCFSTLGEKLLSLRADQAVLAFPGAVDLSYDADLLVQGMLQALSALSGSARLTIGIGEAAEREAPIRAALANAAPSAAKRKVDLQLRGPELAQRSGLVAAP